jgi:hypothetical protein
MIAYIVINLREGDMISVIGAYRTRQSANEHILEMMEYHDTSSSWWKIVEYDHNMVQPGNYDIVIRVSWGSSNRVKVMGMFQQGTVPEQRYDGERYFIESVNF